MKMCNRTFKSLEEAGSETLKIHNSINILSNTMTYEKVCNKGSHALERMQRMNREFVRSNCRMCHGVCGVLVHLEDGKVVKIEGDPHSPLSNGYTCAKGRASIELLYHPDRLKYPLRRVGERGEGKWKRISWTEALDEIAYKFLKVKCEYGPQSIAVIHGTGRPFITLLKRFANSVGTPNVCGPGHICYLPRVMASTITCGMPHGFPSLPVCDFYAFGNVYPKCVLIWGANIAESGSADGICGVQLTKAIRKGAKVIVIDPRRIHDEADVWAAIRPGTDAFLALAMLHVIIQENLYDKEFVDKWTVGFNELAERVKDYPPEEVEEITWIPSHAIRKIARIYATNKPACILWGAAIDQTANNF